MLIYLSFVGDSMDDIFKKMCGVVDYNIYNKMHKLLFFSGVGIGFTSGMLIQNDIGMGFYVRMLSYIFYYSYFYLSLIDGSKYTRDVNEIRILYWEFVKNYNKLNKTFDFNDPVSIYAMFNYLVYKGFLSKNKKFIFSDNNIKDIPTDIGAHVISGNGVCRHISSMMTDILNDYGIVSANVSCYIRGMDITIEEIDFKHYSKEELLEWINKNIIGEEKRKKMIEMIDLYEKFGIYVDISSNYGEQSDENAKIRRYGNHLITYTLYDNKSFYLDPTQGRIYRMNQEGILYDSCDDKILLKKDTFKYMNDRDYKESYSLKSQILLPKETISLEEEKKIVDDVREICENNKDIFEKFYSENIELYEEISDKLVKVKRK